MDENYSEQLELFCDYSRREKMQKTDSVIDDIRRRFGNDSIKRGLALKDEQLYHSGR